MNSRISQGVARLAMAVGLVLFGCGLALAQDVQYNFAPGVEWAKYKTYKWVPIEGAAHPDQITDGQITTAIDTQLAAKGLTKTDADTADLYVGYQLTVNQEKQWNSYNMGGAGWRWGGGMTTATSSTINVGTLGFDVYDPAKKELVWRGSATKTINPSKDPEKRQKNLNKGAAKLLKNFPPPPK